jgi:hypothetical protein
MFSKWKKLAKHLDKHGAKAPATVLEIASSGRDVRSEGFNPLDALPGRGEHSPLAPDSSLYLVRRARIRVEPDGEPAFELDQDFRFGDYGRKAPKAGDTLHVVYDPGDPEKAMIAPPTEEEEAVRAAVALSNADIGMTIGGEGAQAGKGKPVTEEEVTERADEMGKSMDEAQSMLDLANQFMSGQKKPGDSERKGK